ncbi:MAG: T9SS type A sorting domain-containing protein [Bacteroidia bacterium]|nr:T9SS type A sorting domain-containing protein [Bacteroidia bacterium]
MKKIYIGIVLSAIVINAQSQSRVLPSQPQSYIPYAGSIHSATIQANEISRAAGDTLLYMPLDVYYVNSTDSAAFNIVTEDLDGLPTNNVGVPVDFGVYYSTNSDTNASGLPTGDNFYHPWETVGVDSSFFWYATSWFNPAGQADNWLMFGPLTIPGPGAVLTWYDRTNPAYRDGYKIYATTIPSSPVTASDFIDAAFYTRTDAYPSPTYSTDTTWVMRTVAIPSTYSGQVIYLAYNHNANDMDVLYLDEITVVEAPVSVNEISKDGVSLFQNQPNPAKNFTNISYELKKSANVKLSLFDITGRMVMNVNEGSKTSGNHKVIIDTRKLDAGVYIYSLNAEGTSISKRMVVTK